eukprot:gnl/TRDRNA2_/TRDRNA2_204340_c0_seq1.p1 gnl/TRDRNA2_/TRDRNA2_204340_c0~~gnl/TRDRNA2_/TRDRNA2_204340_c0_seq1.p1  ORF type:complete len:214 (+),score=31.64 gnl/TRDRNA2_/TRDRNA2_204340_c0_seq1:57-698(+)
MAVDWEEVARLVGRGDGDWESASKAHRAATANWPTGTSFEIDCSQEACRDDARSLGELLEIILVEKGGGKWPGFRPFNGSDVSDSQLRASNKKLPTAPPQDKVAMRQAQAIEPLVKLLSNGWSPRGAVPGCSRADNAREYAAKTLWELSTNDENRVAIRRAGAVGPLVNLLSRGSNTAQLYAAATLRNVSASDRSFISKADINDPAAWMKSTA